MNDRKKAVVFLCHAVEDHEAVKELHDRLERDGFDPWLDTEKLFGGQKPDFEIPQAMDETDFVLICLSKQSVEKRGYVNKEITWALDRQNTMLEGDIFAIPVKLEACETPFRLKKILPVNLFESDGYDKLVKALKHQWLEVRGNEFENTFQVSGSNPFHVGGAVPSSLFYGRKDALQTISDKLGGQTPQSVSIVGERRMGKTSLLCFVKNELANRLTKNYRYLIVYLDLMKGYCHTKKGLMKALRRSIGRVWREPWDASDDGDLGALSFGLEDLSDDNIRLVLCLDEMENLTRRKEEFDGLLEELRASGSMGQMCMLAASARPLADLCEQGGLVSPFSTIFTTCYLGLLEEEEWRALILDHMQVDDRELDFIGETTGGHPLFVQIAASCLWEMKRSGKADLTALKDNVEMQIRSHLEYLRRHLSESEKNVLRFVAGKGGLNPTQPSLNNLSLRGLIKNRKIFCLPFLELIRDEKP